MSAKSCPLIHRRRDRANTQVRAALRSLNGARRLSSRQSAIASVTAEVNHAYRWLTVLLGEPNGTAGGGRLRKLDSPPRQQRQTPRVSAPEPRLIALIDPPAGFS